MSKQKHRIKIGTIKPTQFDFQEAKRGIAHNFMVAEQEFTPFIVSNNLPLAEALVLIAMRGDAANAGNAPGDHTMTSDDISAAAMVLISLWKEGLFVPSAAFPFTLEQALQDLGDDE